MDRALSSLSGRRLAVGGLILVVGFVAGVGLLGIVRIRSDSTGESPAIASGHNPFTLPGKGDDPFAGEGTAMALSEAVSALPFDVSLPQDAVASDSSVNDVWVLNDERMAVTYANGLRIYVEPWEGIDGIELYKSQIDAGYQGRIISINGVDAIVSDSGKNPDGTVYPAVLRFTSKDVSYDDSEQ